MNELLTATHSAYLPLDPGLRVGDAITLDDPIHGPQSGVIAHVEHLVGDGQAVTRVEILAAPPDN